MFTGIIQAIGDIRSLEPRGGDVRLTVGTGKLDMAGVVPGDSIAVNGVCLTAVALDGPRFAADEPDEISRSRGDRRPLPHHLVASRSMGPGRPRTLSRRRMRHNVGTDAC